MAARILVVVAMAHFVNLVEEWSRFERAAFESEFRLQRAVDDYLQAAGQVPSPAEFAAARRLRFIARHRLRWILHQTRKARERITIF